MESPDKSQESTQPAAAEEDDEVPSSQPEDEQETQAILPLSQATELQASAETLLSQESVVNGTEEHSLNLYQEDTKEESLVGSSSLEVEANNSTRENSSHQTSNRHIEKEEDLFLTEGQNLSEESICAGQQIQETKKRKCDSNESPIEWKKPKLEDSYQRQHSIEMVFESEGVKKEDSVVNISSSSERCVLDDSEDYSLRIEESSQPTCLEDSMRISLETEGLTSYTDAEKLSFPNKQSQEYSDTNSWKILSTKCDKLKKENEELKAEIAKLKGEKSSFSSFNLEDSKKDRSSLEHCSTTVSLENSSKTEVSTQEMYTLLVKSDQTKSLYYCIGEVLLQYDSEDKRNKASNIKIKEVSLMEDFHHEQEKPNPRMSLASTASYKSTSSSGSVGLPGPFPLPGRTRASIQSTISSSSSASSGIYNGTDGRSMKHEVSLILPTSYGKRKVAVKCCQCNQLFPHVENHPCTQVNGTPPSPLAEQEIKDLKNKSVPSTSRRGRKPKNQQNTEESSTSESQQKESSSSGSQPQESSTPNLSPAVFSKPSRPKGRPRKKPFPQALSPCAEASSSSPVPKTSTPIKQPSTPSSGRSLSNTKGDPVLAWWSDGQWYPGWVKGGLQETDSEVMVHYCDGHRKAMPRSRVMCANQITPGTLVLVLANSRDYEEALVVGITGGGEGPVYQVERGNDTRDVLFPSIAVLESQINELIASQAQKNSTPLNFNDLSLENIISEPRKRSAKMSFEEMARGRPGRKKKRPRTPPPSTSHGHVYGPPESDNCPDTDSSTHSTSECSVDLRGKEVRPLDIECSPPEDTHKKLSIYRQDMAIKSERKHDNRVDGWVEFYGPVPEKGSNLFSGCSFLTTHTTQVALLSEKVAASDDERYLPMQKERLRIQIRNGGGKTYKTLHQVPKDERDCLYLISDRACNTPLYLQCVVENIPIYSSDVIVRCCKENKLFTEVIAQRTTKKLAAGYSLSKKTMVQLRTNTGKPLRKKRLLLALNVDQSVTDFWARLVKKLGGLSEPYRNTCFEEGRYDIVVTDKDCDPDLVDLAGKQELPLVSVTWLQQCIITGDCRPYTEHPLYKYNYDSVHENSPEY